MEPPSGELRRQFGFWQATALNVTMIVGAGVFITPPLMLKELPGPWAVLGWLAAGALILVDGLVWAELGAALPGSGGSYHFLLESYGRERWGKPMAFLFIWQFMISGPLELASGLIAMDTFAQPLSEDWRSFNDRHTMRVTLWEAQDLAVTLSPSRLAALGVGVLLILLLYRRVTALARLTFALWLGVLAVIAWVLLAGWWHFDPAVAFDPPAGLPGPGGFVAGVSATMALALYSYLGYYNVCYVGDEVRDPGRTIPRAILVSALLVVVLFTLLHLAMLGTVSYHEVPIDDDKKLAAFSLPAEFMKRLYGDWAVKAISLCLIGSCFASVFAGLLGYSRIPFGAARAGHFFSVVGKVHPTLQIPHVSLLLVGGMTLFWTFFDLGTVITALITTRILEQFVAQVIGVMVLRRTRPDLPRPFRIWLYPLPCLLALAGWLFVYFTSQWLFILLGLGTLVAGVAVYIAWSSRPGDNDAGRLLR
ncbi:MAG: amino acid permease [Gemmataceae bacterium]